MTGDRRRRAIVLGGGGVAGIAWESALVSTLQEAGVDLAAADVVVGTSAGSVVGTALRTGDVAAWYREQMEAAASGTESDGYDDMEEFDADPVMAAFDAAAESTAGEQQTRAALGEMARTATLTRTEAASRTRIGSLLATRDWPDRDLRITVVDAEDGTFRALDAASGVDLVSAVAASCAVPGVYPTITIDGRQYMDGGMRSGTNADVAEDCDRILVVSCGPEAPQSTLGPTLPQVVRQLRDSREVLVVEADAASLAAFGTNSLLLSTGPASAEAGRRQAASVLDSVRAFWG